MASFSQEDSQRYYRWQSFGPEDGETENLWVDLNALHKSQVRIHGILSNTHRQAAVRSAHTHLTIQFNSLQCLISSIHLLLLLLRGWHFLLISLFMDTT